LSGAKSGSVWQPFGIVELCELVEHEPFCMMQLDHIKIFVCMEAASFQRN
jgi:hypothetical protein